MGISAKEAGELVGMSKQGIIRAIHKGTLSATRNSKGEFVIDPAELGRAYNFVPSTTVKPDTIVDDNSIRLQERVSNLERIIRDKDDVIQDLRERLDKATLTHEKIETMTLLLEDKQAPKAWWQRWLGRI